MQTLSFCVLRAQASVVLLPALLGIVLIYTTCVRIHTEHVLQQRLCNIQSARPDDKLSVGCPDSENCLLEGFSQNLQGTVSLHTRLDVVQVGYFCFAQQSFVPLAQQRAQQLFCCGSPELGTLTSVKDARLSLLLS